MWSGTVLCGRGIGDGGAEPCVDNAGDVGLFGTPGGAEVIGLGTRGGKLLPTSFAYGPVRTRSVVPGLCSFGSLSITLGKSGIDISASVSTKFSALTLAFRSRVPKVYRIFMCFYCGTGLVRSSSKVMLARLCPPSLSQGGVRSTAPKLLYSPGGIHYIRTRSLTKHPPSSRNH